MALLLSSVRVMGVNLEEALDKVIANLENKDANLAQAIIGGDDDFDNSEVDIERQCLELVITQTPVASDWREIASCLKLVGDMERIADHCSNLAVCIIELSQGSYQTHRYLKSVKSQENARFMESFEDYLRKYALH